MKQDTENNFHKELRKKMDVYAHSVYRITKAFPRAELYGLTSQLRRAALSVVLNYVEGYARGRDRVHKNFLEISYGSLKESKYLLHFALVEKYLADLEYNEVIKVAEEIGAMFWATIKGIEERQKNNHET